MANPLRFFECGGTRQFTAAFSAAPGVAPSFSIWAGSGMGTLIYSVTAAASDSSHFYAHYTMPMSEQFMALTWIGSFVTGPVVQRTRFRAVFTTPT